jgi:RND family efflux transporter MFP subunit
MICKFLWISAGLAVLAACSRTADQQQVQASSKPAEPLAVQVAQAEARHVERTISVTGSLHPDETVTVSSEVAGRVARVLVDFGQHVRQGQVIAELDKQEHTIQVERSQAALAQALARIGLDPNQEDVTPDSTPAIRQAQAQMEDARSRYESAARLIQSGDISQERFTELEKTFRARQAALDAARDELRTQLASVQALKAELRLAQKRLSDTVLRAPFDGSVETRHASPGQYMKENTPIVTLVKARPLRLRVEIPETATGEAQVGRSLTFVTEAAPGAEFQAVVRQLSPALDARSRSLTAEARLTEADPRLRPGMFVQVRLVVERQAAVVTVPREAVYTVAGLTKVFVIQDGKVVEHRVPPGLVRDGWIEVPASRIRPGDAVAVTNLGLLVDGARVHATPAAPRQG